MNFIKENLFIVLGVTLPLILIVFLSLVQAIQKAGIEPPAYKAAYIMTDRIYGTNITTTINKTTNELSVTLTSNNGKPLSNNARITAYIYQPDADTYPQSYEFDLSKVNITGKGKYKLPIPNDLKNTQFLDDKRSPDGYEYKKNSYRNGNLMTEIFGYRNRNREHSISKKGLRFGLPETKGWNNNTHFIGWVKK